MQMPALVSLMPMPSYGYISFIYDVPDYIGDWLIVMSALHVSWLDKRKNGRGWG
jgi:hypothetical protein